jgi:hypothetical protein
MKTYQDTKTGELHAFDDGVNPFDLDNRNIPATLSETVIPKPSESHVWFNGDWVKDTNVPKGYKRPTSDVPSYNPAWVAFLNPFTLIIPDAEDNLETSIEQINANTYDGSRLSQAVATLPLTNTRNINALVSFDGAIAIPRNADYCSSDVALNTINHILCSILLGGIHAEVIFPRELKTGSLDNKVNVFIYQTGLRSRLRHNWASVSERIILLHHRTLRLTELRNAYLQGVKVIDAIKNFSPLFLLHGYSAMVYQNRSDALSSLWIVIEQLTSFVWENHFLNNTSIDIKSLKEKRKSQGKNNRTRLISVRHEFLLETQLISNDCFTALSSARNSRNDLVHEGLIPDFDVIHNLGGCMFELFELASGINQLEMRRLVPIKYPELGFPEKSNFDEWHNLSGKFGDY